MIPPHDDHYNSTAVHFTPGEKSVALMIVGGALFLDKGIEPEFLGSITLGAEGAPGLGGREPVGAGRC